MVPQTCSFVASGPVPGATFFCVVVSQSGCRFGELSSDRIGDVSLTVAVRADIHRSNSPCVQPRRPGSSRIIARTAGSGPEGVISPRGAGSGAASSRIWLVSNPLPLFALCSLGGRRFARWVGGLTPFSSGHRIPASSHRRTKRRAIRFRWAGGLKTRNASSMLDSAAVSGSTAAKTLA